MIDLTYLKTTTENDVDIIKELIQIFASQLPDYKKDIPGAYLEKNWHNLKELAHKAKNSFQIVGANDQAEKLKQIEILASEEQDNGQLHELIDDFIKNCELVMQEISELSF